MLEKRSFYFHKKELDWQFDDLCHLATIVLYREPTKEEFKWKRKTTNKTHSTRPRKRKEIGPLMTLVSKLLNLAAKRLITALLLYGIMGITSILVSQDLSSKPPKEGFPTLYAEVKHYGQPARIQLARFSRIESETFAFEGNLNGMVAFKRDMTGKNHKKRNETQSTTKILKLIKQEVVRLSVSLNFERIKL